uniref:Uncharacterized protein n=1 Tax=Anguilla anguilla TaxID=7936 RepID=A0A0E9S5E5_ANGAN
MTANSTTKGFICLLMQVNQCPSDVHLVRNHMVSLSQWQIS